MKYRSAISLPVAAACLLFLGPNFAAASSTVHQAASQQASASNAGQHEALKMVPAEARLTKALDARNARMGEEFRATLNQKVHLKNGTELPKGTELVGKVVKSQAMQNGEPSVMTLRFTQADLKNGKTVPIKATIVGLYDADDEVGPSYAPTPPPNTWTPAALQVDQIDALNGADLHSKIAANNSGVLKSSKNNIRFSRGTEFALAIAPRSSSTGAQSMGGGL